MVDAQADSTRVFVKGLPPSFTSDQLASHFGKQYAVTDAHVFPERRIGFVGFQDNHSAHNAVKHFNRSYIRMSKISVDLAKPVEVQRDAAGQAVPFSKHRTSNSRSQRVKEQPLGQTVETSSGKRKRAAQDDGEAERAAVEQPEGDAPSALLPDPSASDPFQQPNPSEHDEQTSEAPQIRSDADWLRGRTNRLLDLVDPEEAVAVEHTSAQSNDATNHVVLSEIDTEMAPAAATTVTTTTTNQPDQATLSVPNARLFIRNLGFDVTEADLADRFATFGKIQEAHIVKDARKSTSKGLAFLQFSEPEAAENALAALDGVSFHGRLIHILPSSDKRDQGLTDFEISKMPMKKQKAIKRKREAATMTLNWNSMYMNPDAVMESIAARLGVTKSEILDPTSADAAVKQAHAETRLIAETKDFLRSQGVSVDAFKNKERDDRAILLKNFPFGTSETELRDLLKSFGSISRFIFPPTGTMALVQFEEPYAASQAVRHLSYKNIKGSVLYTEKAPRGLLNGTGGQALASTGQAIEKSGPIDETGATSDRNTATVFIRNLSFATTSARLREVFAPLPGFLSARVKTRIDPKRPGEILSMGFGFVEFRNRNSANTAISTLNGYRLDGHDLIVQASNKKIDIAEERRKDDLDRKTNANKTKIIIKNLPFQTSKKDVRSLFAPYGQLKTVRVPKRFDNSSRGFGFAEFVTAKEAQNAVDALSDTHLLGRKLVLEFAQEEEIDPEEQIRAMERKTEQQNNRVQLSKLTGSGRQKFVLGIEEDSQM